MALPLYSGFVATSLDEQITIDFIRQFPSTWDAAIA